jgi:hypothetical protein
VFDENEWGNPNGQAARSMDDEVDDFFAGGGGPKAISWKDAPVGTSHQGIITKVEVINKTDKKTGAVMMNQFNKPKKIVILTLITEYRDAEIENDNGLRRMFLQGNAAWELRQYLKANGFAKPLKGGRFKITKSGTKPTEHYNDQNLFTVLYANPTADTLAKVAELEGAANMVTAPADDWGTEKPAARPATTLDSMRSSGNGGFGEAAPF